MSYNEFLNLQSDYRRIIEDLYGIKILPGFDVHHKDMDDTNNDPSNLVVLTHSGHMKWHANYDPKHRCKSMTKSTLSKMGKKNVESGQAHKALVLARKSAVTVSKGNTWGTRISEESRYKLSQRMRGTIWITDGVTSKTVNAIDYDNGLYPYFYKGRTYNPKLNYTHECTST